MYLLNFCGLLLFSVLANAQLSSTGVSASTHIGTIQKPSINSKPINQVSSTQSNQETNCIPDKSSLNVTLSGGRVLNRCSISPTNDSQLFSRKDFKSQPKSVQYRYADEDKYYTLIVYSSSTQLSTNFLEWIVSNIKGSDLKNGDVSQGDERVRYRRADPVPNEQQIHEYVIFAETVENQKVHIPRSRYNYQVLYFLKQQPNQLYGPVGVTNGRTRKIK